MQAQEKLYSEEMMQLAVTDPAEYIAQKATVIDIATELRANHAGGLRTPDAIQLACAITSGTNQFLTGDKKLAAIQEIKVIVV